MDLYNAVQSIAWSLSNTTADYLEDAVGLLVCC